MQFSGSVNAYGSYAYRIGSTDATIVSIEQGNGYGLGGWGWTDNGWDSMGPLVYFQTSGPQTMRVQRREDGISIDQIVLSASTYLERRARRSEVRHDDPRRRPAQPRACTRARARARARSGTRADSSARAGAAAVR